MTPFGSEPDMNREEAERLAAEAERRSEQAARAALYGSSERIHKTTELIRRDFEARGYKEVRIGIDDTVSFVRIRFGGKVAPGREFFFFSEDNSSGVSVRAEPIAAVPEEKIPRILGLINDFNLRGRFAKLYLNDEDRLEIRADMLQSIGDNAIGPIANEYLMRMLSILDDLYPQIMKILWG